MDKMNRNMYKSLLESAYGRKDEYEHDESEESGLIDEISAWRAATKVQYIKSLLNPEFHLSKVPSRIPTESSIAPLKYQFNITPNATGKFCLVIDPLSSAGFLYQSATVDGIGGAGTLTNLTFGQDATIIDQWRLVSSSLVLRYYGNFNQMAGYFVAATSSNVSNATQNTYLTFSNVEDLQNRQVIRANDGVKLIFSPQDERVTDFQTASTYTNGTHPSRWQYLFIVVGDAFPNTSCIRCDYFRNIEYVSTPVYREYIPHTRDNPTDTVLVGGLNTVQKADTDVNSLFGKRGGNSLQEVYNSIKKEGWNFIKDFIGSSLVKPYGLDISMLNNLIK